MRKAIVSFYLTTTNFFSLKAFPCFRALTKKIQQDWKLFQSTPWTLLYSSLVQLTHKRWLRLKEALLKLQQQLRVSYYPEIGWPKREVNNKNTYYDLASSSFSLVPPKKKSYSYSTSLYSSSMYVLGILKYTYYILMCLEVVCLCILT